MVYLGGGIVVVRSFHREQAECLGFHFHHRKTLASRHREYADIWIEYVESKDPIGCKVSSDRRKSRQDVFGRAQVEQRVPRDENQRKPPTQMKFPHVALHEFN